MGKEKLKRESLQHYLTQATGLSGTVFENLSADQMYEEIWRLDTDRQLQKAAGGTYVEGNYAVVDPVEHMKSHGIWRERDATLDGIKQIVDDRRQIMKLKNKLGNQILAYERNVDTLNEITDQWLKEQLEHIEAELHARERLLSAAVKEYAKTDPLTAAALGVPSIGPVTVAHCLSYIDLGGVFPDTKRNENGEEVAHPRAGQEKAPHASSLWAYVGLDKPSHDRYTKGEASGGNKTLRTALYTMADSQIKGRGPYRVVYDQVKERLAQSEKMTKSRNTQGHLIECAWKDVKPSHRHGAAIRAIMKHFLADYWFVGRSILGLSTSAAYPEAILGHEGHRTIAPQERGWEW